MSRLLAIFLIGALAAGCTPGRIDRVRVESGYDPVQYRFVPYNRAMKADVSGNPFGMDQQAFNTLVSETIQPPGVVPSDGSPYRVASRLQRLHQREPGPRLPCLGRRRAQWRHDLGGGLVPGQWTGADLSDRFGLRYFGTGRSAVPKVRPLFGREAVPAADRG